MKQRLAAIFFALVVTVLMVVVLTPARRDRDVGPVEARSIPPVNAIEVSPPPEPVTTEATPGLIIEDVHAPTLPGPVALRKVRPAVSAAAEPPTGPEAGPSLPPLTVLENMRAVFRQYHQRFGGNPVGNNPEITALLNGGNPREIVFLNPEDGMRINERGELVDNWGTPFFFHQLSRKEMEIHSAGPDRRMWTHDDLVIK